MNSYLLLLLSFILVVSAWPAAVAHEDLSFQDLQNQNFTGANMAGFNLTGADLTGANLTDVIGYP